MHRLLLHLLLQVAPVVSAARVVAENVTAVVTVAGATTTGPDGLALAVSELVKTDQLAAGYCVARKVATPVPGVTPAQVSANVRDLIAQMGWL